MRKKWVSKVLKAPLILLFIASFIASIYAALNNIGGINAGTPIIFGIILSLYTLGAYLETRKNKSSKKPAIQANQTLLSNS